MTKENDARPDRPAGAQLTEAEIQETLGSGKTLLTPVEVAYVTKRKPATVRGWMVEGKMRAAFTNGMWYTTPTEVARFISKGEFQGDQDGN